jgi:uncharacterized OB-fold protein/acyl dehydratase
VSAAEADVRADEKAAFLERLRSFVGSPARPPWVAADPVNEAMIRQFCEVMGDANPVYTDPEVAASSVHGGIVAPPVMQDVWVMRGFIEPAEPGGPDQGQASLLAVLAEGGLTAIVATNSDQEFFRYLRPGDHLTAHRTIDDVSEEKRTALGPGHFFTVRTSYVDQNGEEVGVQNFRMLVYRPQAGDRAGERLAGTQSALRPRPAISQDTAFFWEGAKRGELLIQRCSTCGTLRHPPGPMCPVCNSLEWTTIAATGRGEVYSFVVYHYPEVPPFEAPYVVVLVQLEEGVRLVSNLIEIDPSDVRIGQAVEVRFVAVDEELTLPMFVPAGGGG